MDKAIKRAIEGGYECDYNWFKKIPEYAHSQILLDPLFWQALGKAENWGTEMKDEDGVISWSYYNHCYECGEICIGEDCECPNECKTENAPINSWQYHMHAFIDHIITGNPPAEFFEGVVNNK